MKIYRKAEDIVNIGETVVALGNFDGVHLGHQSLIKTAKKRAAEKGIAAAVFTFSNHPSSVLSENIVPSIIYLEEKIDIIESLGVDILFNLPFTKEIAAMDAKEYVKDILIDTFNMREACCGFNYRFGNKASGDTQLLDALSDEFGFDIDIIDAVSMDDEVISSTKIREAIANGDIVRANKMLGRTYTIAGEVREGNKIGRTIGFPTCNIMTDEGMVTPANGVYVTSLEMDGIKLPSITNVGNKPTVGVNDKNIETYIFDFDEDVYGRMIKVHFIEMIREERKFNGLAELEQQIALDCATARDLHNR